MEAELDEEQNRLAEATTKLENSEKQLQKVSDTPTTLLWKQQKKLEASEKVPNLYAIFTALHGMQTRSYDCLLYTSPSPRD